jgi:hypothetical protein
MPFGDTPNTNVFSPVPNDEVPTAKAFIIVTLWLSVLTNDAVEANEADVAVAANVANEALKAFEAEAAN